MDKKIKSQLNLVAFGIGLLIVIIGSAILIGWHFDLRIASTIFPQLYTTKPITAFCMVLSGICLILQSLLSTKKIIQISTQMLASFIIFIAIFTWIQILWVLDTHYTFAKGFTEINHLFDPGQMPPSASFCFILIGIGLFIQSQTYSFLQRIKIPVLYSLISVICIIGVLVILGYLSELIFEFHIWDYAGVAIQTPFAFILIGIALYYLSKEQKEFVWSLDNFSACAFFFGILSLLVMASLSEHSIRKMRQYAHQVSKIEDTLNQVEELQSDFLNYLTAERIYIITGDETKLSAQQSTKEQLILNRNELGTLVDDSPKLKEIFQQLKPLIEKKIELINKVIEIRKTQGLKGAADLINSSGSNELTKEIGDLFSLLRKEAYSNLKRGIELEEGLSTRTFQFLPIDIFSSLLVLFLAVFFLNMRINERKIALEQKSKLESQLRQSQKMDAIGQLTGGIAHDFNNLLGIIIGNLDLLEGMVESNESAKKRVATASNAALRGAAITKRLLAFSRFQQLNATSLSANESIKNAITMISRALGPDIKIIQNLDNSLPPVYADEAEFENVLVNLSVNARDAMPNGGTLMFITEAKTLNEDYPPVQAKELKAGTYACITVSDTGKGMPPEVIEKAFEPFFTTKPVGKGTGLGLAMVYGFAKQSQGYVRIYSEVNHGTSIVIYLPFADKIQPTVKEVKETPKIKFSGLALVVDDEPDLLDIAAVYLKDMGFQVLQSPNGNDALEVLNKNPNISLLVTDVIMPGMNGIDLAKAAKAKKPNLIVVYSSGFHEKTLSEKIDRKLDAPLIRKPYQRKDFVEAIQNTMTLTTEPPNSESKH